jgi:hypothetical protein
LDRHPSALQSLNVDDLSEYLARHPDFCRYARPLAKIIDVNPRTA